MHGLSHQYELYISTEILELCIHRLNTYAFMKYKYLKDVHLNFDELTDNPIIKNIVTTWNGSAGKSNQENNYDICSWMNICFITDPTDGYVCVRDGMNSFASRCNLKLHPKFDSSDKLSSNAMLTIIDKLEKMGISEPVKNKRLKTNSQKFVHWKLMLFMMDNTYSFEFWNLFSEHMKVERELKDSNLFPSYEIDFNNTITKIIDERFALSMHGDLEIMFERKTNYIHGATTCNLINGIKYNKKVNIFMKSHDFIEFVENTHNLYIPEKGNETYILNKSGQYPAWYKLTNVSPKFRGLYFHIDVFMYIILWLDKMQA